MISYFQILTVSLALAALVSCAGRETKQAVSHDLPTRTEMGEQGERRASDHQGTGPLGTKTNPVKCDGEAGVQKYLENLRGPQGQILQWEAMGSGGIGPFGGLVYIYDVSYPSPQGSVRSQIFFDTTFEGVSEHRPASGFRLAQDFK